MSPDPVETPSPTDPVETPTDPVASSGSVTRLLLIKCLLIKCLLNIDQESLKVSTDPVEASNAPIELRPHIPSRGSS